MVLHKRLKETRTNTNDTPKLTPKDYFHSEYYRHDMIRLGLCLVVFTTCCFVRHGSKL
jgi:hypothetical protein